MPETEHTGADEKVLTFLRSLPETRLHREVIKPLLENVAHHVRYTHGASEKGKDFVFLTDDLYGNQTLEVCQIKNSPFSGKAGMRSRSELRTGTLISC